ncbi:hypothetical protein BaRGS_00002257, partial [Batillaria attramentaria]
MSSSSCVSDSNFVLGNAQAAGWPIVYCSDGFCELTGYGRAQVMARGCACKFLYGEDTDDTETKTIDEALENKKEHKTELVLYKKNGNPFWCLMDIVPIKNEKRQVVLFLVSHKDITREKASTTPDIGSTDINDNTGSMEKDDTESEKSEESDDDEMPDNYNYSRRRSRAVLYHISGQLNKQNKAKSKLQQLNRLGSQMPEYKVQEVKKSKLVIVHYGIFKIGWDWLILLCTFYIAIMVPFNATFRKQGRYRDFMYIDAAVEILFGIDIVLNFRTSFVNKNGQVCYDSRLIALNYMRGWFLLDLLAAVPFDLLYAFDINTGTLIHLLKVARLLRLARLLQKIERYSQYSIFVVAILMCMFALLAHWLACIWYAIGKEEVDGNPPNWTVGWLYELSERIDEPIDNGTLPDTLTCYITALYFTCSSLTSVGFGNVSANTNAEKIFSVCAMLVGAMMHAVVFGNVTAFIQRMYARRATFHAKTKDLKEFFRFHHFPKPLKTRMQEYFQTMWSVNNGIDVRDIMKDFPEDLRGEISLHLNREILSLPIFENATQGCLRSIALQTNRIFFGPGEVLIHKGDALRHIYYVCSGSLEVLKDEQVVAILGKGDLFGADIKKENPVCISGCDVRSLAYCELLCIDNGGLVECLQPYPDFCDKFLEEFPNDLTYNLREGHEDIQVSSNLSSFLSQDDDMLLPAVNTLPHKTTSGDEDDKDDPEHSSSSPLLTKFPGRAGFPNGDVIGLRSESFKEKEKEKDIVPPLVPPLVPPARRGGLGSMGNIGLMGPSPAHLRAVSSPASPATRLQPLRIDKPIRPCRTVPVISQAPNPKSEEAVLVHSLQVEVEGTRNSVDNLERRLDSLCHDVKNIGTTLQQLLQSQDPPAGSLNPLEGSQKPVAGPQSPLVGSQNLLTGSSNPVVPGASPLQRQSSSGRPQFFFGTSPDKECFNDIFTAACTQGTCGNFRDCSPPLGRDILGSYRPSPTLSPLSQASINSHTRLLGSEDEKGSPRPAGRDFRGQYYKPAGSDSDHDICSTENGHSSSCSPQTPLSPFSRPDTFRLPDARFGPSQFRRRGFGLTHPELVRQGGISAPDPPVVLDLDLSSGSEESLNKPETLQLEPRNAQLGEVRAPLSRAESFNDVVIEPQDSTE